MVHEVDGLEWDVRWTFDHNNVITTMIKQGLDLKIENAKTNWTDNYI